jgi:hypothetical protein
MNDISKFPEAAYTATELQLARLEALVPEQAACRERYEEIYRWAALLLSWLGCAGLLLGWVGAAAGAGGLAGLLAC